MLTIRSTGSIANLVQSMREVHGRLVPYAAATALTRTARGGALSDVAEEMMRVFHNPRPYTLNSLFVQPASKDDLSARLMVKNQAAGTKPEHFLFPQVAGGARNPKRFEQGLRLMGVLKAGERVVPAVGLPETQYESGAFIRRTMQQVESSRAKGARTGVFAGAVGRKGTRGVWQTSGQGKSRTIKPLFIFTATQPAYRQRLDFEGVAQKAAERDFPVQFSKALNELVAKGWQA